MPAQKAVTVMLHHDVAAGGVRGWYGDKAQGEQ